MDHFGKHKADGDASCDEHDLGGELDGCMIVVFDKMTHGVVSDSSWNEGDDAGNGKDSNRFFKDFGTNLA